MTVHKQAGGRGARDRFATWMAGASVLAVAISSIALISSSGAASAGEQTANVEVSICHRTASAANPYNVLTVSGSSVADVATALTNGHGDHLGPVFSTSLPEGTQWGDIIPAYGDFPGINVGATDWIARGCQPPEPTVYTGGATVSDTVQICTAADATVTISYTSGPVTRTSTESQAAADAAAQAAAQAAADADLAAQLATYPGYTSGACVVTPPPTPPPTTPPTTPPSTPAASAPATVAPAIVETPTPTPTPTEVAVPLPATVEEPEPETVAVPLPATVPVPTSVPAGDGSSVQQSSLLPMGLLIAGLMGLLGTAVARFRRQGR